jgi:hypothetical protein
MILHDMVSRLQQLVVGSINSTADSIPSVVAVIIFMWSACLEELLKTYGGTH